MKLSSIKTRLLVTHLLIAVLATLAASLFLFESFRKLQIGYHEQLLLASTYALAESLETDFGNPHGYVLAKHALGKMSSKETAEFAVFDISGRMVLSTANNPRSASRSIATGVQEALSGKPYIHVGDVAAVDDESIIAAVPMERDGEVIGVVRAWITADDYRSSIHHIRKATFIAITCVIALSVVVALLLARALIVPIKRMRTLSQRIAKGDLQTRVEIAGSDELSQLAEDLNAMASRLYDLENTRREFVGNVSHELRSPVSNIRVTSEVLGRRAERLGEDSAGLYQTIVSETERLETMIDELMELSAIESGALVLHKEPFEIRAFLQERILVVTPRAEQKGITIGLMADRELCAIADRERIGRAVQNLLDNAVKFTQNGGQIVVSAKVVDQELMIDVSDTGDGIAPGDIGRVFERFYRADKARSRKGGTGIGLAIVKHIVEAHGGRAEVRSTEGHGSTFSIVLPVSAPDRRI